LLRYHPLCPWRDEDSGRTERRIPVLLAAFRSIDDDDITAVHRIRLDQTTSMGADQVGLPLLGGPPSPSAHGALHRVGS